MQAVTRWFVRYAVLLLLLFLAGIGYAVVSDRYGNVINWPRRSFQQVQALEEAQQALETDVRALGGSYRTILGNASLKSRTAIDGRIALINQELKDREQKAVLAGGVTSQLIRGGAEEIVQAHRNALTIQRLKLERSFLEGLRNPAAKIEVMRDWEGRAATEIARQRAVCRDRRVQADLLQKEWIWHRYDVRWFKIRDRVAALRDSSRKACASANALQTKLTKVIGVRSQLETKIRNVPSDVRDYAASIADITRSLQSRTVFSAKLWLKAHNAGRHLRTAAIGVGLAIAMPILIRIAFYFVLAPLAARRPAIRLMSDAKPMQAPHTHSAVSQDILIPFGWELLVKQGYLHRAPVGGLASTRWLLSWRKPAASLVRGLYFLTRYRDVPDGFGATLSAGSDPFAELLPLRLEEGQACMLHPRLIVAVLQPVSHPMRITGQWRILSLHAWLTSQLRYLVFHGPVVLVLKGYRGLHVSEAIHDVELAQDHVVGFSANLRYGVVRTGTFQPYLFKKESLLRDVIRSGPGVVVTEEAPSLTKGGGGGHRSRHGLEDALDVVLKFFGL